MSVASSIISIILLLYYYNCFFGSSGDDIRPSFFNEFDLMISNQDVSYTILTHKHIYMCVCDVVVVIAVLVGVVV